MKNRILITVFLIAFCLCLNCMVSPMGISNAANVESTGSASAESGSESETTPAETQPVNGWKEDKAGNKKYYKNGEYVTGLKTINGKTYYFKENGNLAKNAWCKSGSKYYRTNKSGIVLKNKWFTLNGKKYYLGKNGARTVGKKTIGSKTYFFKSNGTLAKNAWCKKGSKYFRTDKHGVVIKKKWITLNKKKFYLDKNGVRAVGVKKVGKKYYYFNKNGVMKTGTVKAGNKTYYTDKKGVLEARKVKSTYYYPNGKKMSKVDAEDFKTLQKAKKIAAQITTSKMSKSQKLKVCFDWVMKKYYGIHRQFSNFPGWPAVYANDHFDNKNGDCHSDAAALAYLAKAIGYKKIYVCNDSDGTKSIGHCWAEINGLVYDPLFAQAKNYNKYYGAKYSSYKLRPVLKIAL